MKNLYSLLLIISSTVLLNSCAPKIDTSTNSSPSSSSSSTILSSAQPESGSKAIIDKKFLEEYRSSQNKVIELLNERVNAKNDQTKLEKIRQDLLKELPNFKEKVDLAAQMTKGTSSNARITELQKIITFDNLSKKDKVAELQSKLNLNDTELGNEKDKFGKKTKKALVEKIQDFEKELETLSEKDPNKTTSNSKKSPTVLGGKIEDLERKIIDLSWANTLLFLLGVLSIILASIVGTLLIFTWRWYQKDQLSPKNEIRKINNKLSSFNPEFEQDIQSEIDRQVQYKYRELLDKIEKLSRQVEASNRVQNVTYNPPDNFMSGRNDPSHYPPSLPASPSHTSSRGMIEPIPRPPRQPFFINEYNQDSSNFSSRYGVEEVLEEQSNIEGRRGGIVKTVNLSPAPRRRGAYWVFSQDNQYLVVPSDTVRIQEHNQEPVNAIFDYGNFNPNYSQLRLIEPAIVTKTAGGYQLVRKGRIEFA